jgi:site-specific DNA recombinase
MSRMNSQKIRCAIYTRKSTEEGLEQEFNSLDAQRESAEAFITSQQHEGWVCLPDRYDDGGYTGGNMDRPALRRLMADIQAGKVDCVVVYKVDRLSRSLLDFARIVETFEKHNISFVSVTQQFNTTHSMGRLTLNILLSFAQFEREIISERTRDKIAATRRKGKWSGGMPLLGYDVVNSKLVVNKQEADKVQQIFQLYLEEQAMLPVVRELNRRGWSTKRWTTKKKTLRGGKPFNKGRLYALLTNVAYTGKVKYKKEVHTGEQEAIVGEEIFKQVQMLLRKNGRAGGKSVRNQTGSLLSRILRCKACDCAMGHSYTVKGQRRYRYYVCMQAQQHGWRTCPAPSVPAGEIEKFVIDQIKTIGLDPKIIEETAKQTRQKAEGRKEQLKDERMRFECQRRDDEAEVQKLVARGSFDEAVIGQLACLREQVRLAERRLTEIQEEMIALNGEIIDDRDVAQALGEFDALWNSLIPKEQSRILELLIDHVNYNGKEGTIAIAFHPSGIKALKTKRQDEQEDAA